MEAATTAALSPANTYSNGSLGVGATLTATGNGTLTVDGHLVALNDRILVKDEAAPANQGIYLCTTAGTSSVPYVLTRSADMNTAAEVPGAFTFVVAAPPMWGTRTPSPLAALTPSAPRPSSGLCSRRRLPSRPGTQAYR